MRRLHRWPSPENRELYEELRNEGASDEKATRISNAVAATEREVWIARHPERQTPSDHE